VFVFDALLDRISGGPREIHSAYSFLRRARNGLFTRRSADTPLAD
jgi:hypothetical protein